MTLGPALPKAIMKSSMIEHGDNLYIIGGTSKDDENCTPWCDQKEIHQLSCISGLCSWTTLTQQLKDARYGAVAIPVDDSFCA